MGTSALQKLTFSVHLLDHVTGPLGQVTKGIGDMGASWGDVLGGVASAGAAMYALHSAVQPAREFAGAVQEIQSLSVGDTALASLTSSALQHSIQFGESAAGFVRSAYDIQSAIGGLEGADLGNFTSAANVLAKGTKADADTVTDYMGTMFGIFEQQATSMGKSRWVEQLAGQTATAVEMYKTTGSKMADYFSGLGAEATTYGIDISEQMAIGGLLGATLEGGEAATKYGAYLGSVGEAQAKLGLRFTNADGSMMGMLPILDQIRGKFGDTISVAEGLELKKAFGSGDAVDLITSLLPKTEKLRSDMQALSQVKGMEKAVSMANTMVDPFAQWAEATNAIRIGLGTGILSLLNPIATELAPIIGGIGTYLHQHPKLARFLGMGAIAIAGVTTALGLYTAGVALATIVSTPLILTAAPIIGGMLAVGAAVGAVVVWWDEIVASVKWAWNHLDLFGQKLWGWASDMGIRLATLALMTNPFGWIGITILWWDELTTALSDFTWFQELEKKFDWIEQKLSWIPGFGDAPEAPQPPVIPENTADVPASLEAPRQTRHLPKGGVRHAITQSIRSANTSNNSTTHIENINTSRPINFQEVESMMWMGA